MKTAHLEAFITVVDAGSFTRAAARLSLSQPTVTNRIKALEQTLGATLLERHPQGVAPTPAGRELVPYARQIITLNTNAHLALSSVGQLRGRVEVGTTESLTNHRLLPLIEYVYLRYPSVEISMRSPAEGEVISLVRGGQLDCAFFVDRVQDHPDVETSVLCPEPLFLVAAPDHPLVGRSDVRDEDLLGTTLVRSDSSAGYHLRLRYILGALDAVQPRVLTLNSVDAAKRGVANGVGMALMPRIAVADELATGELRRIDWTPPFETFTQLARRSGATSNPVLDAFVDAAVRVVEEQLCEQELAPA
ncbi:LysR family transcriptional regulator [Streptomyces sp. JW3]|uniref:LysR family transcriptional regulator n=1 Tax=Streptomyces sp. JW3 TaxID=3456955 RepID=UPI003FA4D40C